MTDAVAMRELHEQYTANVNADLELKAYRDWIERNMFGFGERSFIWMWKNIVDEMPHEFTFLEVGVFRGQILGLVKLLANRCGKVVHRIGVTPLDESDGHWKSNYAEDIEILHQTFFLKNDYTIIKGHSTHPAIIAQIRKVKADVVYIDGGHDYQTVVSDLTHYPKLVKKGGLLVIDDCNNAFDMPDGYFRGIEAVSKAVDEVMPPVTQNKDWAFRYNLVHNRVLQRI